MESLDIGYFKAFSTQIKIPIDRKNCLLFGENGSGKSSIFEAIKIIFFSSKIESQEISSTLTPEDAEQAKNDLYSSFNNKTANRNFSLTINDSDYISFTKAGYQVFMISSKDRVIPNRIELPVLLSSICFDFKGDINDLINEDCELIELEVNSRLKEFKEGNISIRIDKTQNFRCIISDSDRNITFGDNISTYFNEAKLNLIILLLLLTIVQLSKDSNKSKVLVLDDFITSLDSSNRMFLTRYILKEFDGFQKLIFTHNISFYNLTMFVINEIDRDTDNWYFYNLYEFDLLHKLYKKSLIEKASDIQNAFNSIADPSNQQSLDDIGNRIRKKFEMSLHKISKHFMIGVVEENSKLLDQLCSNKFLYLKKENNKIKTIYNLIDEISIRLANLNETNLKADISNIIATYKILPSDKMRNTIRNLKLYQKVTMHPLSHAQGSIGLPTFHIREIEESLLLLVELELMIDSIEKRRDIVNV
ncbi:AAA family ATPase [Bacteroidales bacterium OttesenSCG-928-I14]|nr:AAA family ATPase [Bacteroidales bacterium OttesenSCG-928-I14]